MRVFGSKVLRRIFEPKKGEVTEEWRKLHSEELHKLHTSLNIAKVIRSRRMSCVWHVVCMGKGKGKVVPVL
jgi:hypothetical protein